MTRTTPASRLVNAIVSRVARLLKVPPLALRMFRAANDMSGLDRKTLPTELIPLNTIQLSRGLLNFTALQALPGWVFPYWAVRQYDPGDPAFIPRSHLGLSVNLTHRNWTAVGSPECPVEPIVDPAGAVTPFRNGWSIDVWLRSGAATLFPSRSRGHHQSLLHDLPIVFTSFEVDGITLTLTSSTHKGVLTHTASAWNRAAAPRTGTLAIAARPFNPEGVALTHDVRFDAGANRLIIDESESIYLSGTPAGVRCSNRDSGDSAAGFAEGRDEEDQLVAHCASGFANAHALFPFVLQPGEEFIVAARVPLEETADARVPPPPLATVRKPWDDLLASGTRVEIPDAQISSLLRASTTTLLQFIDGDTVTPGPWTYHQFWFRDAAVMLRALDAYGFHGRTRPVIERFPSYMERDGYYRSQQGEWDSNGQALWTVWQHTVLSHNTAVARELFEALSKGLDWIRAKRLTGEHSRGTPHEGLLPAGLSAEHLGLADYYFWDNWWALAGVRAYARLCITLGEGKRGQDALILLEEYRGAVERAVTTTMGGSAAAPIPAGPGRTVDCGMIGTCAAWYPLQELPPENARMHVTLEKLSGDFLIDGLFYQDFIHSGLNAYLTLQLAQAWLHGGHRAEFWRLFSTVAQHASPTLNYPEAIHPGTGGGAMGDGHHGWAAAEVCLAIRNALVREVWTPGVERPEIILLSGIPREWTEQGFRITGAPVPGGTISIDSRRQVDVLTLTIAAVPCEAADAMWLSVRLPLTVATVRVNGRAARHVKVVNGETWIDCGEYAGTIQVTCEYPE